ncbi:Metallo-beta-lactamase [Gracilaria domingensis]|nr:Metallo-beta-lactamase [Gracilaria domingensis]
MDLSATLVLVVTCCIWQATATSSTCALNPTIYSFTFASLNCTVVSDGPIVVGNVGNVFSVPGPAATRSYKKNFRDANPVLFAQNVLIVDLPAGRALFDSGSFLVPEKLPELPGFENAGQLTRNLRAAHISPSTIDFVFLTHGHVDHVAGIVTEDGKRAFPNAQVFVGVIDHMFWSLPSPSFPGSLLDADTFAAYARIYQGAVAPYERDGSLRVVDSENEDEASPVDGVTFISTFGHSPGHCAIEIKQGDDKMVFVGDAWISTADQLQNPEWGFFTETNRTEAYLSREKLLTDLAHAEALALAFHESFPGLGFVQERGPFFEWVPMVSQNLGFGVKRVC